MEVLHARCAGLDVHKDTVVAGIRTADGRPAKTEVRTGSVKNLGQPACRSQVDQPG